MNISEKAAYLKGLFEGMEYDPESKEGKLFKGIIELLEDISLSVLDLEDEQANTNDYLEDIDDDLAALEEDFYGDDCCCCDDDDCCCCDDEDECDDDCCCGCKDEEND